MMAMEHYGSSEQLEMTKALLSGLIRLCRRSPKRTLFIVIASVLVILCVLSSSPISVVHTTQIDHDGYVNSSMFNPNVFSLGFDESHCNPSIKREKLTVPSNLQFYCDVVRTCVRETKNVNLDKKELCPCIPEELYGDVSPNVTRLLSLTWTEVENSLKDIAPGGYWRPDHCAPRRRVAVIVPYRDREQQLRVFLAHYHPIFQRQLIEYQIFVIEQNTPYIFNKGSLMNVGFLESQKLFGAECIIFVDVDTLAQRDDNIVLCGERPVHWAGYVDRSKYNFIPTHFGAAVLLTRDQFTTINGFPNIYWGWGGEDDNFKNRILREFEWFDVSSKDAGRFLILGHHRDETFMKNSRRYTLTNYARKHSSVTKADGLNTVRYELINTVKTPLYTWIVANVLEHNWDLLKFSAFKSTAQNSYKRSVKTFESKKHRYLEISGHCVPSSKTEDLKIHYKSVITCKFLCDTDSSCIGFQYTKSKELDSFCVHLQKGCDIRKEESNDERMDLVNTMYIFDKYESYFHVVNSSHKTA